MTDRFLTTRQLAELLGVSVRTLYRWRKTGHGPRPIIEGKWVRYQTVDVDEWLEAAHTREAV